MPTEILDKQKETLFILYKPTISFDKTSLKGLYPYQTPLSLWSNIYRNEGTSPTLYLARILEGRGDNVWIDPNARSKSGILLPECVAVHGTPYGKRLLNKISGTPRYAELRVVLDGPITADDVLSLDKVTQRRAQATYWQEQTRSWRRIADQERDWMKYERRAINALAEMTYLQAFGHPPFSPEEIYGLVLAIVDEVLDRPDREWIEALRQSSLPNSCC